MPSHLIRFGERMEHGDLKGQWWLPNSPDLRVPGTLRLTQQERPRLEVSGSILEIDDELELLRSIFGRERSIGLVWGRTNRGVDVTIADCRLAVDEMEWGRPEAATYRIVGSAAYLGGHFDPETAEFSSLSLEIQRLADWLGTSPFEQRYEPSLARPKRIEVAGIIPPRTEAVVDGGEAVLVQLVSISGSRHLNPGLALKASFRVSQNPGLVAEAWFGRFIGPLSRLLSLAAGRLLAPERVVLAREKEDDGIEVVWPHPLGRLIGRDQMRTRKFLAGAILVLAVGACGGSTPAGPTQRPTPERMLAVISGDDGTERQFATILDQLQTGTATCKPEPDREHVSDEIVAGWEKSGKKDTLLAYAEAVATICS
jgi:hypothetical protein